MPRLLVQIILLLLGIIFGIGVVGEKENHNKPILAVLMIVSFILLYLFMR